MNSLTDERRRLNRELYRARMHEGLGGPSDLKIVEDVGAVAAEATVARMPESFGRNLDTLEKARLWLTNPHNWHSSRMFIIKWNGLVPSINEGHARRLMAETWDDGLPWSVVYEQRRRKAKGIRGEPIEEEQVQVEE
jgi:hypothetical protein